MLTFPRIACSLLLVLGSVSGAGATPLLTSDAEAQIEDWLDLGDLHFTKLFAKRSALDTTAQWHAAVDSQGPTISLMSVTDVLGRSYVIGGYNPLSWDSSGAYHFSISDTERTAFIFNLTTHVILAQKPADFEELTCRQGAPPPATPSCGKFQTLNYALYGPTFGAGYDLNVGFVLDNNRETGLLNVGMEEAYSYGPSTVFYDARGLLPLNAHRCGSSCGFDTFTVDALETYALYPPPTHVPEPGVLPSLTAGMLGLAVERRTRRNRTT